MKYYHVMVEQENDWFTGQVLERGGVITQGRSLDELVFMLRDAIKMMWNQTNVTLELIIPQNVKTKFERQREKRRSAASVRRKI